MTACISQTGKKIEDFMTVVGTVFTSGLLVSRRSDYVTLPGSVYGHIYT